MDKSFNKFLRYLNKEKIISFDNLKTHFNLNAYETLEVIKNLCNNQYATAIGDNKYQATYKAKNHYKTSVIAWFANNWLSIIAIIVSIIALFK